MIVEQLVDKSLVFRYFLPDRDRYSVVRIVRKDGKRYHTVLTGEEVERKREEIERDSGEFRVVFGSSANLQPGRER